jgi:hypothetical protein
LFDNDLPSIKPQLEVSKRAILGYDSWRIKLDQCVIVIEIL